MYFIEEKGDLFDLCGYTLAHCVSIDNKWGAGIALEFDRRFINMKNVCIKTVKENEIKKPSVIYYISGNVSVFNLYTKDKYYHKPTYDDMSNCLVLMKNMCLKKGITKLAMPRIGCGLDKLKWSIVRDMIKDIFKDTDINIVVRRI